MRRDAAPRGMTLVELLVAMVLALGATAALGVGVRAGLAAGLRAGTDAEAAIETAAALEQLTRDLRAAGYDPRGAGFPPFTVVAADSVELQADLDSDGAIDATSEERVAYRVAASSRSLQRIVGAQSLPILSEVASGGLRFAWLDAAGATLDPDDPATAAAARLVAIDLAATPPGRPVVRVHGGVRLLNR
ncbi:MAG: prepilin-type N-terminal cleavage/methylation domain-containing protein [Deltaproteobacteria bacterium]|nr:prepilin-type N-terminal cleavage/methylation domain-containing protein [Deltaproteobacteria bacterium]